MGLPFVVWLDANVDFDFLWVCVRIWRFKSSPTHFPFFLCAAGQTCTDWWHSGVFRSNETFHYRPLADDDTLYFFPLDRKLAFITSRMLEPAYGFAFETKVRAWLGLVGLGWGDEGGGLLTLCRAAGCLLRWTMRLHARADFHTPLYFDTSLHRQTTRDGTDCPHAFTGSALVEWVMKVLELQNTNTAVALVRVRGHLLLCLIACGAAICAPFSLLSPFFFSSLL